MVPVTGQEPVLDAAPIERETHAGTGCRER
jgi:hypothetical protein